MPAKLFERIPYILVDSRDDVRAFLGYRHVTGIKEWNPAEKAQYIAQLIEKGKLTYDQVMRKIGSKTPTVRQNYFTYRLLLQMEGDEDISVEHVEEKFSVLYLSLRTTGCVSIFRSTSKQSLVRRFDRCPAPGWRRCGTSPSGSSVTRKARRLFGTLAKSTISAQSSKAERP